MAMDLRKLAGALLVALALGLPAVWAQEAPAATEPQAAPVADAEARRQARIEAYLQKKEQKRLDNEVRRAERDAARTAEAEARAQAQADAEADALAQEQLEEEARLMREQEQAGAAVAVGSDLPRSLRLAQENVRESRLGADPTVAAYLDLVDRQQASPHQLAALGNFLAEAGLRAEALEYYRVALMLEKNDPLLWMNLGTIYRQGGDPKAAANAYGKALSLDRNYAEAHYNLGAALDEMGKYDEAIREYKVALTLDPALGDPAVNPQAANNDRLMTVRMLLYREIAGSAGLPLADVPQGGLADGTGTGSED
jgi:Flp pilus assembly protein TadD